MNRILLTGATGFLGRHCLPLLLARGDEVHAVSAKVPAEAPSGAKWHEADLLDSGQVLELVSRVRPSHLLHFAWYTVPGSFWTSLENFRWVQASLTLLQAFGVGGGRRVVMAGTCAEYDWSYGYCSESITPLGPKTVYGVCKHALHTMLDAFGKQSNLSVAWGRIFFLYGPHEHPDKLVSSVIRSVLRGESARCSHGNQVRDYLHVQDAASAFVALLHSDVRGPVNIASGRPVLLKDIVYKIARTINREDLIQLGTVPTSTSDPPLVVADVRRLVEEVGVQLQYDLEGGLEHTIRWWEHQVDRGRRKER